MTHLALEVRNGCKSYGSNCVLNGINLGVSKGNVYGLLGASGCGKTTLILCLVGLEKLESGNIYILGEKRKPHSLPGSLIGYSPQETALYPTFKIREAFAYYGRIYGLSKDFVKDRIDFLVETFHLTECQDRVLDHLSGGEKRRVSLGIALLHEPELLILDEPTVGLDPLVRHEIWEYLRSLNSSILLTTHYTEEARYCDKVGYLRDGKLLLEGTPGKLELSMGYESMEDVVLAICKNPVTFQVFQNGVIETEKSSHSISSPKKREEPKPKTFQIVKSLFIKNLMKSWRYPLLLIVQLILPFVAHIFSSQITGKAPVGSKVAFITGENGFTCERNSPWISDAGSSCWGNNEDVFCRFTKSFEGHQINWVFIESLEKGLEMMDFGKIKGVIQPPKNVSYHLGERILYRNHVGNETLREFSFSIWLDETEPIGTALLKKHIFESFQIFMKRTVEKCGENSVILETPLKFHPIYGDDTLRGFRYFMAPALLIWIMFILGNIPGIVLVQEKRLGLLSRDFVSGLKPFHIFLSSLATDLPLMIFQILSILFLDHFILHDIKITSLPQLLLTISLVVLTTLSGLTLSHFNAVLFSHELHMIGVLLCVCLLQLFSSGTLWPLEGAVEFARPLCYLVSLTMPIISLRGILLKDWGLENTQVLSGFIVAGVWVILPLVGMLVISKLRRQ